MGYYAELVKGDPITIDNPEQSVKKLLEIQGGNGFSWIGTVENYVETANITFTDPEESAANALLSLLSDYGFDIEIHPEKGVLLTGWSGEKIGGSWDDLWKGIGAGVSDDEPQYWIMRGEDGQCWAEMVRNNGSDQYSVDVHYSVNV